MLLLFLLAWRHAEAAGGITDDERLLVSDGSRGAPDGMDGMV